mgnify:FL=1
MALYSYSVIDLATWQVSGAGGRLVVDGRQGGGVEDQKC